MDGLALFFAVDVHFISRRMLHLVPGHGLIVQRKNGRLELYGIGLFFGGDLLIIFIRRDLFVRPAVDVGHAQVVDAEIAGLRRGDGDVAHVIFHRKGREQLMLGRFRGVVVHRAPDLRLVVADDQLDVYGVFVKVDLARLNIRRLLGVGKAGTHGDDIARLDLLHDIQVVKQSDEIIFRPAARRSGLAEADAEGAV